MGFLREVLGRPEHERPILLAPVGYPGDECRVPAAALKREPLEESPVEDRPEGGAPGG